MLDYLASLPDTPLFILLSCFCILVSVVTIFLVRRYIPYHVRFKENQALGTISQLIGLIYGVLAGLSALYLINNNSYTADAVQREANAVADIYRDSKWLKDPARDGIQKHLKNYIRRVVGVEWALMKNGKTIDINGDLIIEAIANELVLYRSASNSESLLLHDMLDQVRTLYDSRQQRIHMSYTQLSPELWAVILLGTILTLCINFLFGMNFYLHIVTISAVALMTTSMIFLLITLDRPFQGEFAIEPVPFTDVARLIIKDGNNQPGNYMPGVVAPKIVQKKR